MSGAPMVIAVEQGSTAVPSCVTADVTSLCARVYEAFGLDWLAANADALIEKPATILLVVVLAAVVRLMLHRAIHRLTDRTATGAVPTVLRPWRNRARQADRDGVEQIIARRTQRAEAIGSVLRSFASIVVLGIGVVLVLGELGLDLAPIIASAGVIGVALGFGAQNLVKDFIAGIGIILEDQYGVGDVVDLGEASGTVEAVACGSPGCGTSTAWSGTCATARCCASGTGARGTPRWSSTCPSRTTPTWTGAAG